MGADNEPEPVHGDGDHSQWGHEGRHAGNGADKAGRIKEIYFKVQGPQKNGGLEFERP